MKMAKMVDQGAWTGTRSYTHLQSTQPWSQNHHNTPIVVVERSAASWEGGIICVTLWRLSSLSALTATSKGRVMLKQLLKPEALTAGHSSSLMRATAATEFSNLLQIWRRPQERSFATEELQGKSHWLYPSWFHFYTYLGPISPGPPVWIVKLWIV